MLGQHLVGSSDAGRDAGSGVRDPKYLQQLLHGAVLAVAPVQRDERDLGLLGAERVDQIRSGIDRQHLVPESGQCLLDAGAGAQRHLALE